MGKNKGTVLIREMKYGVFKDVQLSAVLEKEGVVAIPFLKQEELEEVKTYYNASHKNGDPSSLFDDIHMTVWDNNLEYKLGINEGLKSILRNAFERNFQDYRAISEQFILKKPGAQTNFPIHQDWSIVDENHFYSLNIWIPLQDVDESNGAMWIVKGSHRIDQKIRGAGVLFPDYISIFPDLQEQMTLFPLKAGQALIFFHSTIHGSPPNTSSSDRRVVQVSLLPKDAPVQIYFQQGKESPLEVHHPKEDFNFYYNNIREDSSKLPPSENPTEIKAPYTLNQFSIKELVEAFKA
jgi:hypothetical protein